MNFHEKKAEGKKGEQVIIDRLRARGWSVIDCSEHKHFQTWDIDLVIDNGTQVFTVDVKTDAHASNNFYIEVEKETTQRPGRIYTTCADWWFYYFPVVDRCFVFNPEVMAEHVAHNTYKTTKAMTQNGPYKSYSVGKLVPTHKAPIFQTIENVSKF